MSLRGEAHRRESLRRRQQALVLHDSGMSYRRVGLCLNIRKRRAGQLIRRALSERKGRQLPVEVPS